MSAKSWLECSNEGCRFQTSLLLERKFVCPKCGNLFRVAHDFSQITERGPSYWKGVFDARCQPRPGDPRNNSGVWRFHEMVMPLVEKEEIISLGEGLRPFWQAGNNLRKWIGGDLDLWIMPAGLNPTGSFKDDGGTVATSVGKKAGITLYIVASSGDTAGMVVAYAAKAGIKCVVVIPKGQTTAVQRSLLTGAKVILLPGSFDDCMRVVKTLISKGMFPLNSINPTRVEGHKATVFLTAQFFGWTLPDAFLLPIGNGSNASSVDQGMSDLINLGFVPNQRAKIIGVQSQASNPLAQSWEKVQGNGVVDLDRWEQAYQPQRKLGRTTATAARIGDPVSRRKVMRGVVQSSGAVLTAGEKELNEAVFVASQDGMSVCPQTGQAIVGAREAVARGILKKRARVLLVSTACGMKFPEATLKASRSSFIEASSCSVEEVEALLMGGS